MKNNSIYFFGLMLLTLGLQAQKITDFKYVQPIQGVSDTWHQLVLPMELYGKAQNSLADVRVVGVNESDTFLVPFFIQRENENVFVPGTRFDVLNPTTMGGSSFVTLRQEEKQTIDHIKLNLKNLNFDYRIGLAGSLDQLYWNNVLTDYRIVGIRNDLTQYSFTTLKFPKCNYNYYRIKFIKADDVEVINAKADGLVSHQIPYDWKLMHNVSTTASNDGTVQYDLELSQSMAVTRFKVEFEEKYDYFRSYQLDMLVDSFKNKDTTIYQYRNIRNGVFSSLENGEVEVPYGIGKKYRLSIDHLDDAALTVKSVSYFSPKNTLQMHFQKQGDFFLCYGNSKLEKPKFDISRFKHALDSGIREVKLGELQMNASQEKETEASPLFKDQGWIWALLLLIAALLIWYTIRMISQSKNE